MYHMKKHLGKYIINLQHDVACGSESMFVFLIASFVNSDSNTTLF